MNEANVEIGLLTPPWAEWLALEKLSEDAAVVAMAERIFSASIADGCPSSIIAALIVELIGPDAAVHAWLHAHRKYLQKTVSILGADSVCGDVTALDSIEPGVELLDNTKQGHSGLSSETWTTIGFRSIAADLIEIGFPPTFLTPAGFDNRIGLIPHAANDMALEHYPSYEKMLDSYEIVVIPGGFHLTDCLIASKCLNGNMLMDRVRDAIVHTGSQVRVLDTISGSGYDEIAARL